jgi:hypothetical protein
MLSYFIYGMAILLVLFMDLNFILHYFMAGMVMVLIYNNPSFKAWVKEIADYTWTKKYNKKIKSKLYLKLPFSSWVQTVEKF